MTLPTVEYHVAHCSFLPERVAWLESFRKTFPHPFTVHDSKEKVHSNVWCRRMLTVIAERDLEDDAPDWTVMLNDDVTACPQENAFAAALQHAKSSIVSFHTRCTNLTDINWCKTYWQTGPAYAYRKGTAADVLKFYDLLPPGFHEQPGNNEDVVGILYAWSRQEPVWSTVPALVKHRLDIPSTLGYDHHGLRDTAIPYDHPAFKGLKIGFPAYWEAKDDPPFIENPWASSNQLKQRWMLIKELAAAALGDEPSPIMCCFCLEVPGVFKSDKTDKLVCRMCVFKMIAAQFGVMIGPSAQTGPTA